MLTIVLRAIGGFALGILVMAAAPSIARAATPVGHQDMSSSGASDASTGQKPESKLWFNDGTWWGSLWSSSAGEFRIWRYNPGSDSWTDTGVGLDTRSNSLADTLWDGTNLWVASHVSASDSRHNTANRPARLWKFTYAAGTYTKVSGFPIDINGSTGASSETFVIDKAGDGTLWATWTQAQTVYVAHSNDTTGATWTFGPLTVTGASSLNSDDISSLVRFGGNKIGVMWSNQAANKMYFAVHTDGGSWAASETVESGTKIADDHINLKSDPATGIVYAVVKTSLNDAGAPNTDPILRLMVRSTGGTWTPYTVAQIRDGSTRPIVELDVTNGKIYTFMTSPESDGPIYMKVSDLGTIGFPTGKGTVFIQDSAPALNNATSTKQNVGSATGSLLLVEATQDSANQYWHNELALGGGSGNRAPVAANDGYSTPQGTPLIQGAPGVLGNDSDPDGNTLTAVLDSTVAHGSLTLNADGSFTYTPAAGYSGADSFTYHAFDGALPSSPATVGLTVTSGSGSTATLNPVADAQVKSTSSSSNYGTLASLRLREDPNSGTTYRSYLRFDLRGLSGAVQSATLRLYVNDASRDATLVRPVSDTTWAETSITWSNAPAMGGSTLGSATPSAAGGYVEIPLSPGSITTGGLVSLGLLEDGTDSAIFSSREGDNRPELVVTTATGGGGNTAPTASAQSVSTQQDTPLDITLNATDPETCQLTFAAGTAAHGTVALKTNQACVTGTPNADSAVFTYTPAAGYSGPDSFTFTASDGTATSAPATVSITVTATGGGNTTPTASPVSKSTNHDTAVSVTLSGTDPESCTLAFAIGTSPSHGTLGSMTAAACVSGSPNTDTATVQYTPAAGYTGGDSFTYTVTDGDGATSSAATVTLTVVNTRPTATGKIVSTQQDTPLDITLNATDPEDCQLAFAAGTAAHGTVALKSNQACVTGSPNADSAVFTYTPASGYSGPDSFTFTASDGIATSTAATVNITVTATGASGSLTVGPTADAYVKSNSSKQFGTTTTMECREGSGTSTDPITRSYLTFDVSGIAGPVSAITLRLYVADPSSNSISVHAVDDTSWTETGIVWSNAPALDGASLGSVVPSTLGDTVEIQVDPSAISADGTYSFALQSDGTNTATFATREDAAHAPELEITYGS